MNLKDLKYLVALADTGHFGKVAAERTFVSQPTLSAQLKKLLEDYLGVKLVERGQPGRMCSSPRSRRQVVIRAPPDAHMRRDEIVAPAHNNTDRFLPGN